MNEMKQCPYCGKEIRLAAKKCRYCGKWMDQKVETAFILDKIISDSNEWKDKAHSIFVSLLVTSIGALFCTIFESYFAVMDVFHSVIKMLPFHVDKSLFVINDTLRVLLYIMVIGGYYMMASALREFAGMQRLESTKQDLEKIRSAVILLFSVFIINLVLGVLISIPGFGTVLRFGIWIVLLIAYGRMKNSYEALSKSQDFSKQAQGGAENCRFAAKCQFNLLLYPVVAIIVVALLVVISISSAASSSSLKPLGDVMQFLVVMGAVFGILCLIWTFICFLWPLMGWYKIKEGGPNENIGNVAAQTPPDASNDSEDLSNDQEKQTESLQEESPIYSPQTPPPASSQQIPALASSQQTMPFASSSQVAPIVSSSQTEMPPIPNYDQARMDRMSPIPVDYMPQNASQGSPVTYNDQPNFMSMHWKKVAIGVGVVLIGLIIVLLISQHRDKDGTFTESDDITFSTYMRQETAQDPEGVNATISLGIDIPKDNNDLAMTVTDIIKLLMGRSEIANEIGSPIDGTLYDICEDYLKRFQKGISNESLYSGCIYQLEIQHIFHSTDYIVFRVADGIYGNGGPNEYDVVFRLSDKHQMKPNEMYNLSNSQIKKLIQKYAGSEIRSYVNIDDLYNVEAQIVPYTTGCRLHYNAGSSHIFDVIYFPLEEIEPYLTEEGRKVFAGCGTDDEDTNEQDEVIVDNRPGRGELGIFDLRGPVKSVKWKKTYGTESYTFDKNGFWLSINGESLQSYFLGEIKRDSKNRIIYGSPDAYGVENYVYNDQGLATSIYGDGFSRDLTYDSDGYVKKEVQYTAPEMGDDESDGETRVVTFTILEKDAVGNWTKRRASDGFVETRKITYY